ncbi:reverse transcriptase domain-containing protein [Chitinibacter sp. FCG-7]|uniref:RNA-directed DNA polymerase n=1 Tax=Chitinibacter mangrovi TaxID=3153927 RepID=A0AAU7F914_9NEIS
MSQPSQSNPNLSNSALPPNSREAILQRMRDSSKDEVILEEMRRQGFWPKDEPSPEQAAALALIEREGELVRALHDLSQQLHQVEDPQAALKAMRKERMRLAREKREVTRRQQAQRRYDRALAWHTQQQNDITYLGEDVSQGLADPRCDEARLASKGLPHFSSVAVLAQAMGVTVAELRFLSFSRNVTRISHYRRFTVPKKTGGVRLISAPMPRLKRLQYWILEQILLKLPVHAAAQGFVAGRSIVSNATPHTGQAVVVNFDLQDFFPSIHWQRVSGLFQSMGYSKQLATILALICSETPCDEVAVDGAHYFVQTGVRRLPQGAPSSPALTNLLCRRLDTRLSALAQRLGFRYTRYADDMTFSAADDNQLARLLWQAKQVIREEGFTLHPDKQKVMRRHKRQEVTGIVVNQQPAVCRETLRRFRAVLFQVEQTGPTGKHWNGNENVLAALAGYAQFIVMVDAEKGRPLLARVRAAQLKWSAPETARSSYYRDFRTSSSKGIAPKGITQMAQRAIPIIELTQEQHQQAKQSAQQPNSQRAVPPVDPDVVLLEQQQAPPLAAHADTPVSVYLQIAVAFLALMLIGLLSLNYLLSAGSIVWVCYCMQKRKFSWWGFLLVLIVCRWLWQQI